MLDVPSHSPIKKREKTPSILSNDIFLKTHQSVLIASSMRTLRVVWWCLVSAWIFLFSFTSTSPVYSHASVDVFTRASFLSPPVILTQHKVHRDRDVTLNCFFFSASSVVPHLIYQTPNYTAHLFWIFFAAISTKVGSDLYHYRKRELFLMTLFYLI